MTEVVPFHLDTGFNGYLTLERRTIEYLRLSSTEATEFTLGDGSVVLFKRYFATVFWNGAPRRVVLLEADGSPLLGMSMLEGCRLTLEARDDGPVCIEPLAQ